MSLPNMNRYTLFFFLSVFFCSQTFAEAQKTKPEVKAWNGSLGGGLTMARGNSDNTNFNLSLDLVHDPKTKNVLKFSGLYMTVRQKGIKNSERLALSLRDDRMLGHNGQKAFAFAGINYMRDPFKKIEYLYNPTAGFGYRIADQKKTKLSVTGGLGGKWEKASDEATQRSGTVNTGQEFSHQITSTSRFYQKADGLWKAEDFSDSLLSAAMGLTTHIIKNMELKVELRDDYKSKPSSAQVKKNDTITLISLIYKF